MDRVERSSTGFPHWHSGHPKEMLLTQRCSFQFPTPWPALFLACSILMLPAVGRAAALDPKEVVLRALANHPEIRVAQAEIAAAQARRQLAGAWEPPSVSLSAGKLATAVSGDEKEASLRVGQKFAWPGSRQPARKVAELEVAIAQARLDGISLRVRGEVLRACRGFQADEMIVQALIGLREAATDIEQQTTTRLGANAANYLDVLRPRLERARIENDLVEAERTLREERRRLNLLMGIESESSLVLSDSLRFVLLPDSLSDILANALQNRPSLRAAALEIEARSAGVQVAHNDRRPTTELSIGLDRVPGAQGPGLGGEISFDLPFVPWTRRPAAIQEARAHQAGAEAGLDAGRRNLESRLRDAWAAAQAAKLQIQSFQTQLLPDAQDALRAATQSYRFGQIGGLELLEALRVYRSIELESIRSLLSYHLALIDLDTAE